MDVDEMRIKYIQRIVLQHGFNNNTTPRFDDAAAKQAWGRTLALFNQSLRG